MREYFSHTTSSAHLMCSWSPEILRIHASWLLHEFVMMISASNHELVQLFFYHLNVIAHSLDIVDHGSLALLHVSLHDF